MASDSLVKTLAALFHESMRGYGIDGTEAEALEALGAARANMHLFAYVPFDAEEIRKLIVQKAKPTQFEADIRKLLTMYIHYGARTAKALSQMRNVDAARIRPLIHRYGVVDSARNKPNTTITLDRVAAAFPVHTMTIARAAGDKLLTFAGFKNCPLAQVSAWAAFAVDEDDWRVAFTCAYRTYLAINERANGRTKEQRIYKVRAYVKETAKGGRMTDEQKTLLNLENGIYVKQDGEVQKSAGFEELLKEVQNYVDTNGLVVPKKDN
jgi:Tenuivirus/Phlebovirus nucleocapsid protein